MPVPKRDVFLLTLTLISCSIGPGMLSYPRIWSSIGFLCTIIFLAIGLTFTFNYFRYIVLADYHGNFATVTDIIRCTYGPRWALVLDISLVLCNTGFLVSYISVTSDYIRTAIMHFARLDVLGTRMWQYLFKVIISVVIFFPLSLLKSIDAISNLTFFSLLCSLVVIIMIIVRFAQYCQTGIISGFARPMVPEGETVFSAYFLPIPNGAPVILSYFLFFFVLVTAHVSITPIQREFGNSPRKGEKATPVSPTLKKRIITYALIFSSIIIFIMYILIGVLGSLMFDRVCSKEDEDAGLCIPLDSNILLSFKNDDAMMVIMLVYSVVVMIGFTCLLYPIRASVCKWFKIDKYNGKKPDDPMYREFQPGQEPFAVKHGYLAYILIGIVLIVISCVLSIAVPEIDKMNSVFSNIFGVFLYEILGIFVWHKRNVLKAFSIGSAIDKAIAEWDIKVVGEQGSDTDQTASLETHLASSGASVIVLQPQEEKKRNTFIDGIKRLGEFRRSSLFQQNEHRSEYSIYVNDEDDQQQRIAEGVRNIVDENKDTDAGARKWTEEETEPSVNEELPKIDTETSLTSTKTHEGTTDSVEPNEDDITATGRSGSSASGRDAKGSIQILQDETHNKSLVIYNRDNEAAKDNWINIEFPDVSKEPTAKYNKYPRCERVGFLASCIFFAAFGLVGLACNIYDWIPKK